MSLTLEIAQRISETASTEWPEAAEETVLRGVVDSVGVMLAGWHEPVAELARSYVGAAEIGGPFDLGIGAPAAGLVYGTAAHALDFDDTGLAAHPSAILVPAVLAEGLEIGASGRALVAAYLAGYEVWAELWRREPGSHHAKGWHPTAIFGALAAAAASASLRRTSVETTRAALGIAASFASGLAANFGSMTKSFQVGRAVANGLESVRLAERGLGASLDVIEHDLGFLRAFSPTDDTDRSSPLSRDYGRHVLRYGLNIKLYPVCYALHRAIDGMLFLRERGDWSADEVTHVEVVIGATQAKMLRHHRPRNSLDAKFSLEFAMAAAAIAGQVSRAELDEAFLRSPKVQAFFEKVRTISLFETAADEPMHSPYDQVVVSLENGRLLDSGPITHPVGHFRRRVGLTRIRDKFMDCAVPAVSPEAANCLFETLQRLTTVPSVTALRAVVGPIRKAAQ
jgi:aconitate decarboxylase